MSGPAGPAQSGNRGTPAPPLVVSCAVAGPPTEHGGPVLREGARSLRSVIQAVRADLRADGEDLIEGWQLGRITPDERQRWFQFPEHGIDERRWDESLAGIPGAYDTVQLSAALATSGSLELGAPSHLFDPPTWDLVGHVTVPSWDHAKAAAERMLESVRQALATPGVTTGFVSVDSLPDPYSRFVAPMNQLTYEPFDTVVHGYYWAVALSATHLGILGGHDHVRDHAPCEVIEEVAIGTSPGLLCRITDSPLDITEDKVRAWRTFLLPVLRPGYPTDRELLNRPESPLSRPMWIYEGPVAPRLVRFALRRESAAELDVTVHDQLQDPERPTFWLYTKPEADLEGLRDVVTAIVGAWRITAFAGELAGTRGHLRSCTSVTIDTDDDQRPALVWQADLGDCDPEAAVTRLAAALGMATPPGQPPLLRQLAIR